jgi:hypothetical protein
MSNGILTLDPDQHSLETLRKHTSKTYARLVSEGVKTAHLVPRYAAFLAKVDTYVQRETALEDGEALADAGAIAADTELNKGMEDVAHAIHGGKRVDPSLPKHQDYFDRLTVAEAKKPVLGTQLERMEGWYEKLKQEPLPALQTLCDAIADAVKVGIGQRQTVKDSRAASTKYRLYDRRELFAEYNAMAATTLGDLTAFAESHPELRLPSDWPVSCYLHLSRNVGPQSLEEVDQLLELARARVAELETKRLELEKKGQDSALAQSEATRTADAAVKAERTEQDSKKARKVAERAAKDAKRQAKKK